MKNLVKLIGIAALVAVIGFSIAACGDGADSGSNPSGGSEIIIVDKLEISGAQVFTATVNEQTFAVTYTPYTGDMTLTTDGVNATITGGKLSFSLGIPDNLRPVASLFSDYRSVTVNDPTAKGFTLNNFSGTVASNYYLDKSYYTVKGNGTAYTSTTEFVTYVYVDKDITFNGTGSTDAFTEDGIAITQKTENCSLVLKAGWNVVYEKIVDSGTTTSYTSTMTKSVSNPSHLRWILFED